MTEKLHIIEDLGESRLALPSLTRQALSANDRAKYYFTLLQSAQYHADQPESPIPRLAMERSRFQSRFRELSAIPEKVELNLQLSPASIARLLSHYMTL
ncbi:MAG TPA: hypothetical protein VMV75_03580 [Sulfuricella sp.]|nr:hypothetical protein [Sulfuricella sp.]